MAIAQHFKAISKRLKGDKKIFKATAKRLQNSRKEIAQHLRTSYKTIA
jgi:hypothetical protein